MTEAGLGSGEQIYAALEAGEGVVPYGPLEGVRLHVAREVPDWNLPDERSHTSNTFSDDELINRFATRAVEELRATGIMQVPSEVFETFYERGQKAPVESESNPPGRAAFETLYTIKAAAQGYLYNTQKIIELNTAKAIVGSYRNEGLEGYRGILMSEYVPMRMFELHDFFATIEERFQAREDRSQIGTQALTDEIERLVTQVMNGRWSVLALPEGDGTEESVDYTKTSAAAEDYVPPTQEEVQVAFQGLIGRIGSERIVRWRLGFTLDGLGGFVIGKDVASDQNPLIELRQGLVAQLREASDADAVEIREMIRELQDLGDLSYQYRNQPKPAE